MNKSKRLISLLLSLTLFLSIYSPLFSLFNASADTKVSEIKLTSSTTSVEPGALPEYSVASSSDAVKSVDAYDPTSTYWAVWAKKDSAWRNCNANNPAFAVNDGITHYAMRVSVNLKAGYTFDDETKIYFNGADITYLGHTTIQWFSWGGYVYIDLGTAGKELPKYTLSYDPNGGSGSMSSVTVYEGESIKLAKCKFTPPSGLSFQAWKIGDKEFNKFTYYTPTANVTAKAVWTDKYITESRATMTPAAISDSVCANDLVFSSLEPQKYSVSLWRVFDLTDDSLNTANMQYPTSKKFVAGHKYAIEFQFKAEGNYYEYDETASNSVFYLNGKMTDISAAISISGSTYRRMEFSANEQSITKISATITDPVQGNRPDVKPTINTTGVTFGDYDWYDGSSVISKTYDTFQAGHTYRLKIRANTTLSFSDSLIATINGKVATIEKFANNSVLFSLDFTIPGGSYTLTFNANGGSGNMPARSGISGYYTLPSCAFTPPDGKIFKCWIIDGIEKNPYDSINITKNTIISAIWADKPHQHSFVIKYNDDYHYKECSCGQRVDVAEHSFVIKYNDDYHYKECSCGQRVDVAEHSFSNDTIPQSAYAIGYTQHKCNVCAYSYRNNFKAPTGKPSAFKCLAKTAAAEKFSWKKIAGVSAYQVQLLTVSGKNAALKETTSNAYTFTKLVAGYAYRARVRFYIIADGKKYFSQWTTINSPTLPATTSIIKLTPASKAFTAQWRKGSCTGYQMQYCTNAKFSGAKLVTIKNSKTLKYSPKKLNSRKIYYVRVRTYKTINKVNYYSAWSAVKKVKTK